MPRYGSVSAVVENRKGSLVQPSNLIIDDGPVTDELTSTPDIESEFTELFTTLDYELIVDEPDTEEQDLAVTELFEE